MERLLLVLVLVGFIGVSCGRRPVPRDYEPRDGQPGDRPVSFGECAKDEECAEICEDIFGHRADRKACLEELPVRKAESVQEVYEVLNKPSGRDLDSLNLGSFEVLLNISIEPVETAAKRMEEPEAKDFLAWVAKNSKAARAIKNKDRKFNIFKNLVAHINSDVDEALSASIYRGDNFIEVAANAKNNEALDWVDRFFDEDCGSSSNYNECMFKNHYCDLALDSEAEYYYFSFPPFYTLLEEVLEEARPSYPPSWWGERVDVDEVDTWLGTGDVCGQAEFS